ncbi:hypothetical protein EVAR_3572_1 [Eumeta japonica]|uniref:C2H2-type domain-containing protein n=1 Tax=Eumeta variegata TaxID=151549 RepID=A0A4C1SW97_EUMVA|nr:hypothetical protein EVAR_3572_1 [Eumeta japonica]
MPSIFSKNAIISGEIDYYCLVCDDRLKTEDSVNAHIQKVVHQKNLDQKSCYVKDYEIDKIRKVNKGYYCEYCNILLTSALKISLHVKHKNHKYNKSDDIDVTTSNKHAKCCAYCNIEFDNEELHKTESTHVLNLIQAQLLIGEKRSVYRKIDNHTFHCITCNEVLPLPTESHFEQDTHDERYMQCRKDKKILYDKIQKKKPLIGTPKKQIVEANLSQKEKPIIPQAVNANELNNINKKFENKVNTEEVTRKKTESNNDVVPELDPLEALVKKLNLKDYIYSHENGNLICILCEWDLSSSVDSVKAHIQGRHHQQILKLHKQRVEKEKKEKTICGNQKETKESKNDFTSTAVMEDNSKSENALKENDCSVILTETDKKSPITDVKSTDKTDILSNVADLQKHAIAIDFICEKAFCKKCNKSLPFEIEAIRNHIEQHGKSKSKDCPSLNKSDGNVKDGTKLFTRPVFMSKNESNLETPKMATTSTVTETDDQEKIVRDVEKFASENHINYNFSPNQAYCRICKTQIPNGLNSMKEHVQGARHTRNTPEINVETITPVVSPQKPHKTKSFENFIVSLGRMKNLFQELFILNKKFCITPISFHIITRTADRMRCHMCEKNFNVSEVNNHLALDSHTSRLMNTPVIISEEMELIRIPRNGIFHCGFCNLIIAGWNDMQNHVKSLDHRNNKMKSDWALEEFLPEAEAQEMRDEFVKMVLMGMLNNL